MIDNYQDFDTMAATMLNEFVEKILVHDHERDFRRSFSISHWAGKKNWSIEISTSIAILKRMFKLGCWHENETHFYIIVVLYFVF